MAKKTLLNIICATGLILMGFGYSKSFAALAEFGAVTSNEAGKTVFAVSDGSTFARYCLVELTVKDKKIHWISHPLEKDYVKREPDYIYNFNKDYLIIATKGQKNKDESIAQLHLYHKPQQNLELLAQAKCEFPSKTVVTKSYVEYTCGENVEKVPVTEDEQGKIFAGLLGDKTLDYTGKSYEAKSGEWRFEVKETDNYFKDRLQIIKKNAVLKEYQAKDFIRCFEYETIKGSQDKFSS